MDFHTEQVGDIMVVELPVKSLDASNSQEFKRDISSLLEANSKVIFDMAKLGFVDSSGCGAILSCLKKIKGKRGELKICGLQDRVSDLLKLMRLERVFDIKTTKEDAINAF